MLLQKGIYHTIGEAQNNLAMVYEEGLGEISKNSILTYSWYATAYVNGKEEARKAKDNIALKLTHEEIHQANTLAEKYILKYSQRCN